MVKELQEEYSIFEGNKKDEISARRIGILLGDLYASKFKGNIINAPIIEKDGFDLALEYRLKCDPLEKEEKFKGKEKKQILCTWGVDKVSGVEGYTTQLKEWTVRALLEPVNEEKEDEDYGTEREESRLLDTGSRAFENFRLEEAGIG